ncbi:MAG: WG repeat-containing protein [Rikenellaceae bacterium]
MLTYPTITEYLNAIQEDSCFKSLNVNFLRNQNNELIYFVGHDSLVLKVSINDSICSLKLYTSHNSHRETYFCHLKRHRKNTQNVYIPKFLYLNSEIRVYIDGKYQSYPTLVTQWIDGKTLNESIKELTYLGQKGQLYDLTNKFIDFSKKLIQSEITHLDLKPENIICTETSELQLIDIDAIYLPDYKPEIISEQGTVWYRHPLRKAYTYEKYLHDYPILVILVSLLTVEIKPEMYALYTNDENLLFSPLSILKNKDKAYNIVKELFKNTIYNDIVNSLDSKSVKNHNLEKFITIIHYIRFKSFANKIDNFILDHFDEYITINDSMFGIKYANLWSFVSINGDMVTPFVYSKINRASEDKIVVLKDNLWHIYTLNFTLVSSFEAEDATFFSQGLIAIRRSGKWGYIDENCKTIIDFKYDSAKRFKTNMKATVNENGTIKEINKFSKI